jgi:predicted TIM-barrel fold metal-dependent hydrolase
MKKFVTTLLCMLLIPGILQDVQSQEKRMRVSDKAVTTGWEKRIQGIIKKGKLPIIDTEATYGKKINIREFIEMMDEHDVALVAFAPKFTNPEKGSSDSLRLFEEYPEYFVPTTTDGTTKYWFDQSGPYIEKIEREVKSGKYYFMGEHELRHYMSPRQYKQGKTWRDISIPPDSPWVHEIFRISAESGLTFQIHHDPEDGLLKPLEKMLEKYPGAKVIWCHLGQIRYPARQTIYSPDYVDRLLTKYQNLYFDIAVALPGKEYPGSGFQHNTLQNADGTLVNQWKAVLEKHSSRFTVGSDIAPDRWDTHFPAKIEQAREILSQLSSRTAERIAYQNAWYLITGTPWAD